MAKAYIANKPVRFDRNYKVGEVIPDGVISPMMGRRLVEMGRILCVDIPDNASNATITQDGAQPPTGGDYSEDKVNTKGETADAAEGESDPPGDSLEASDIPVGSTETTESGESDQQEGAEPPQDGAQGKITVADLIAGTGGEFVCETCGRTFQSQQGLAAHSRTHKE